jgi:hypothetical protein
MQFTPLHRLLGRAPTPLSDEMIDEAVNQGIAEADDLDWKSKLPPAKGMSETDYRQAGGCVSQVVRCDFGEVLEENP